ncbi:MAG: GNAT family N-acetyltransferase [Alphaproteobacteria bacterium]|nr:GNAT family N-acetyltransferase [Alphaproteobacteria bacterium]
MATFRALSRAEVAAAEWDAVADGAAEAWLWHRHAFGDALSTWPGRADRGFALFEGDTLVGLMPAAKVRMTGDFSLFDSVGGPIASDRLQPGQAEVVRRALIAEFENRAKAAGALFADIALPAMAPAYRDETCPRVNPLLDFGYGNQLGQTYVIDLRSGYDAIWNGMEGRARTAVRQAEKAGVTTRLAAANDDDLSAYYRLHCRAYARTETPPHPRAYFEALWRDFLASGRALVLFAEKAGEVIAAANIGIDKKAAVYWTAAGDEEALRSGATSLLQVAAIKALIEAGVEFYEVGEAFPGREGDKLAGLDRFKRSFGGRLWPWFKGRRVLRPRLYAGLKFLRALAGRGVAP